MTDTLKELERLWASSGLQNGELYAEGGTLIIDDRYLYDIGNGEAEQGGDWYELASMNPQDAALIAAAVNALPELLNEVEMLREATAWRPIETAPKGNGDQCELVTDPEYIEPPKILMLFENGDQCVVRWDWYYAEGGYGHHKAQDGPAWIIHGGSNLAHLEFGNPVAWRFIGPLPEDI